MTELKEGKRVLFVSYDGLTDALGRSQILPYLTGLSERNHEISILSCEKPDKLEAEGPAVASQCERSRLAWYPIKYHRRPPILSSIYDAACLTRAASRLHRQKRFDIVHCRSYIPALAGLHLKRKFQVKFLFDMRGFWPEEKTEGGSWNLGNPLFSKIYNFFKKQEAEFLANADHIVSLTRSAQTEMRNRPALAPKAAISVIPCCVELSHFELATSERRSEARAVLGIDQGRPVLAYLGSLGGNYMLGEMLEFFVAYKKRNPGALFLFVTRDQPAMIVAAAAKTGVTSEELMIVAAAREQVPLFLAAADLGVAFKQPLFSALACSPTKLGEMLAVGIPVVANSGVGDVEELITRTGAGVIVNRFDDTSLTEAVAAAAKIRLDRTQVRAQAAEHFDLQDGIEQYDRIYRSCKSAGRREAA